MIKIYLTLIGLLVKILKPVDEGILDIIPDEMGQRMYNAWREDPSKLSEIFSDLYYAENIG
ncbi:hypothetical protein [Sphingobacterium sp. HMA12]|uniref:hypothetical protein n=1 Tax=Sphingobacterium sp. HMA12 TaxID=2050894 RepID=UPI000CE9AFDA|nr:hypothetical protein [Sphingobacterium sp. HMA12]